MGFLMGFVVYIMDELEVVVGVFVKILCGLCVNF